jgi:hypothetical protein
MCLVERSVLQDGAPQILYAWMLASKVKGLILVILRLAMAVHFYRRPLAKNSTISWIAD